jgi:aspartate aminotransferase
MKLSHRILSVEPSQTVQFSTLIQKLTGAGKHIIDFAVGEPGFDITEPILSSTKKALDDGKTRYSPVAGIQDLKSKIAVQFEGYDADNLIISNGSKQILYTIFQVLCNPADEVIIPSPYWVSFAEQVKLASATPVFVNTRRHQLDLGAIERAITSKTRAILINSPNNPTGAVYPAADLKEIAELAISNDLCVIADEAYRFFVFDGIEPFSLFSIEALRDRCITVGSFSKTYAMTGFRIGFAAAPKALIQALSTLQSHMTGNACTFAQYGALAALNTDPDIIEKNRVQLEKKREIAYGYASKIFSCIKPQGAFYIFPDIARHLKLHGSAANFASMLLEKSGVAVVAGEAFGMPGHIRISYALPENELIEGFERMINIL